MTLPSMAPVSLLFLLLLANAAAAAAVQAAPAPPRPNLLFMMTDQQRWDTMSAVVPSLATPNMDRIAKEGVLFKWGYTSTPTCTPARAAILTGQKPWNHGSLGAVAVAHSYPFEMPTTLAALGYSTTSIGKDHFGWVSDGGDGDGDGATVHFDGPDASTCLGSSGGVQEQEEEEEEEEEAFPPPWGPNKGHGVPHGYQQTSLYDGIVAEPDDYHQWFEREMGGKKPETGWPSECDVYHPPPPPLRPPAQLARLIPHPGCPARRDRHELVAWGGVRIRQREPASHRVGGAAGRRLHQRSLDFHLERIFPALTLVCGSANPVTALPPPPH
jgi:arylsulfatase A-like enzyme